MSPVRANATRAGQARRSQGFTRLGAPRDSVQAVADPRLHLELAKSLVAAARHGLDQYLACMDAVPLVVNVAHVIDAADLLDAAAHALQVGRR